jgi:ubiquinone/menaquinone biosynthesis C-methylase UbiE
LKKRKNISKHKNVQPSTAGLNDNSNLARMDWAAKRIAKRTAFIKAKNVLEFGGGDLSRIFALASAFLDKVFYSIDLEYSKNATDNIIKYADLENVNIIKADARSNIFIDNSFDFAFSIAVGEHIAELDLFLEETYRVLKPGGEYYFGQGPFWTSVKGHHFLHRRPEVLDVLGGYEHLIFSAEEMRAYLKSYQNLPFDIEDCVSRIYFREDLSRLSERETRLIIERSKFIVDTWSTQYDDLYDEQKAQAVLKKCSKYTLNDLKIKGVVAVLRKPVEVERKLESVRTSSHTGWEICWQAVASPGRNTILLPYRLVRLCIAEFKKRKAM